MSDLVTDHSSVDGSPALSSRLFVSDYGGVTFLSSSLSNRYGLGGFIYLFCLTRQNGRMLAFGSRSAMLIRPS